MIAMLSATMPPIFMKERSCCVLAMMRSNLLPLKGCKCHAQRIAVTSFTEFWQLPLPAVRELGLRVHVYGCHVVSQLFCAAAEAACIRCGCQAQEAARHVGGSALQPYLGSGESSSSHWHCMCTLNLACLGGAADRGTCCAVLIAGWARPRVWGLV
jgi:hypothetical protein